MPTNKDQFKDSLKLDVRNSIEQQNVSRSKAPLACRAPIQDVYVGVKEKYSL